MVVPLDSGSQGVVTLHIVCTVVITLAVVLRFLAKYRKGSGVSWDDGLMLLAWVTVIAYIGMVMRLLYLGSGQMLKLVLSPDSYIEIYILSYAAGVLFETANIAVKLSLLYFYCRIFSTSTFRKAAVGVGIICGAWWFASAMVTILQCIPVQKAWHKEIEGHCLDLAAFVLGYEITNAALDITLICMPLRMIQTLQLERRQKILISCIFMLGGFVCIASILRIVYLYHPKDPYGNYTRFLFPLSKCASEIQAKIFRHLDMMYRGPIWSTISISSAVLCGNLPLLKPILTRSIVPASLRAVLSSWSLKSPSKQSSVSHIELKEAGPYNPLGGDHKVQVSSPLPKKFSHGRDPYPINTISLTTTVDVD
ncbi:hypothetical protein B0J14DRAFT_686202 [Halenospora varia]|nr:hypothetical protein B0J14DRAFT_686202 [Halenospora varia]